MVDNAIKFRLVENLPLHLQLEKLTPAGSEPVCASMGVVFQKLEQDPNGKCYYPFFLREPFTWKNIDFCELIEPKHLQQLKNREITPLVVMLSESWTLLQLEPNRIFRNSTYFNVIDQLVKKGIREEDVVWLICNQYQPADPRAKAKFIHADFYLEQQKLIPTEFMPLTDIKNKFLSLARGTPKHHRFAMTYMLYKNDLIKHGKISCREYENFSYMESPENSDEYISRLDGFDSNTFEQFKTMLPLEIGNEPARESWQSPINLHQDGRDESHLFRNTFLNLVNETHQQDDLVFITEKTYRSINYCRPFVINGDRGSLRYLKDMGFKTFDKFWDESYDEETSDHARITKLIELVTHITSRSERELLDLFDEMLPVIEHNYKQLKNIKQWSKLD